MEHRFWGSPKELLETEKEVAGTTHAELGALAAQRWGLPSHVAEVIRDHHVLRLEPVGRMQKTAAVVQLIDFALFPATATRVSSLELPLDELARRLAPFMPNFLRAVPIAVLKQALEEATAEAQAAIEALGLAEPTTH